MRTKKGTKSAHAELENSPKKFDLNTATIPITVKTKKGFKSDGTDKIEDTRKTSIFVQNYVHFLAARSFSFSSSFQAPALSGKNEQRSLFPHFINSIFDFF